MAFAPAKFSEQIYQACLDRGRAAGEISTEDRYGWRSPWFTKNYQAVAIELISDLPKPQKITLAKFAAQREMTDILMACFAAGVDPRTVNSSGRKLVLCLSDGGDYLKAERFVDGGYTDEEMQSISRAVGKSYAHKSMESLNAFGRLKKRLSPKAILTGCAEASFPNDKIWLARWAIKRSSKLSLSPREKIQDNDIAYLISKAVDKQAFDFAGTLMKLFSGSLENLTSGHQNPFATLLANTEGYKIYSIGNVEWDMRRKAILRDIGVLIRKTKQANLEPKVHFRSLLQAASLADPKLLDGIIDHIQAGRIGLDYPHFSLHGSAHSLVYALQPNQKILSLPNRKREIDVVAEYGKAIDLLSDFAIEGNLDSGVSNADRVVFLGEFLAAAMSNPDTRNKKEGVERFARVLVNGLRIDGDAKKQLDKILLPHSTRHAMVDLLVRYTNSKPESALLFSLVDAGLSVIKSQSLISSWLVEKLSKEQCILLAERVVDQYREEAENNAVSDAIGALMSRMHRMSGVMSNESRHALEVTSSFVALSDEHAFSLARRIATSHTDLGVLAREMRLVGISDAVAAAAIINKLCSGAELGAYQPSEVIDGVKDLARIFNETAIRSAFSLPAFVDYCKKDTAFPARPYRLYLSMKHTGTWKDFGGFVVSMLNPSEAGSALRIALMLKAMSLPHHQGEEDAKALVRDIPIDRLRLASEEFFNVDGNLVKSVQKNRPWGDLVTKLTTQIQMGVPSDVAIQGLLDNTGKGFFSAMSWTDLSSVDDVDFHVLSDNLKDVGVDFGEHFRSWAADHMLNLLITSKPRGGLLAGHQAFREQHVEFFIKACNEMGFAPSRAKMEEMLCDTKRARGIDIDLEGEVQATIDHFEMMRFVSVNNEIIAKADSDCETKDDTSIMVRRRSMAI